MESTFVNPSKKLPSECNQGNDSVSHSLSGKDELTNMLSKIKGRNAEELLDIICSKEFKLAVNEMSQNNKLEDAIKMEKNLSSSTLRLLSSYNERIKTANMFIFLEQKRKDGFINGASELKGKITTIMAEIVADTIRQHKYEKEPTYKIMNILDGFDPLICKKTFAILAERQSKDRLKLK